MVPGARAQVQAPVEVVPGDDALGRRSGPRQLVDETVVVVTDQLQATERHVDQLELDVTDQGLEANGVGETRPTERYRLIADRRGPEATDEGQDLRLAGLVLAQHD